MRCHVMRGPFGQPGDGASPSVQSGLAPVQILALRIEA